MRLCITRGGCGHRAALLTKRSGHLGFRDALSPSSRRGSRGSIHRGYKRGIRGLSTGSSACCTRALTHRPHSAPGYPQGAVEDRLYELASECSHSADTSEGRPAATETALSLAPRPATRGAVVSMPTAHRDLAIQPSRKTLTDPMPLSECLVELVAELAAREGR